MDTNKPRIWRKFLINRKYSWTWARCTIPCDKRNKHRDKQHNYIYLPVAFLLLIQPASQASTTIASPQSSSSGTVVNNGYQILNGPYPVNRFSQGIQCSGSNLTISPFITAGDSHAFPNIRETKTPRYNDQKNEDGSLKYPGKIDYWAVTPKYDQSQHNLNYGVTLTVSIPIDSRMQKSCLKAAKINSKLQQFLLDQKKLESNLKRLEICGKLLKEGLQFKKHSQASIICSDVKVTVKPGQVLPHVHKINYAKNAVPYDVQKEKEF